MTPNQTYKSFAKQFDPRLMVKPLVVDINAQNGEELQFYNSFRLKGQRMMNLITNTQPATRPESLTIKYEHAKLKQPSHTQKKI